MNEADKHWVAGYLEGEAYFGLCKRQNKYGTGLYTSYNIDVSSSDREPLEKLQKLFGGQVSIRKTHPSRFGTKTMYRWSIGRQRGCIKIMAEILPLMSPRRQQKIREILEAASKQNEHDFTIPRTQEIKNMYERFRRLAAIPKETAHGKEVTLEPMRESPIDLLNYAD